MLLADAAETAAALFIGEIIGWVIVGVIWLVGVLLFFLARSYSSFAGVAAISCGVLILVLVALKADIKALDDPHANQLIGSVARAGHTIIETRMDGRGQRGHDRRVGDKFFIG